MTEPKKDPALILLVEDNRAEARLTKKFLEGCGYEVIWVEEGTKALRVAKTQGVDCVLLDLQLPDINGAEVCRWLKGNDDTRIIPIIMLTAKSSTEDKVAGFRVGADDYLPKPYSDMELHARIYACLRNKSLQDELRARNGELQVMLDRVEFMAVTDPLTGMFNRRRFETIVETEFIRMKRYGSPLTCLMVDIDFFKEVNDEFGHRAGDQVLKDLAVIIKDSTRQVDTAARWGGEEFVILLPETDKQAGLVPANRILSACAQGKFTNLPLGRITVSIGIVGVPDVNIASGERLIDAADMAMYGAKRKGRNRIEQDPPSDLIPAAGTLPGSQ